MNGPAHLCQVITLLGGPEIANPVYVTYLHGDANARYLLLCK